MYKGKVADTPAEKAASTVVQVVSGIREGISNGVRDIITNIGNEPQSVEEMAIDIVKSTVNSVAQKLDINLGTVKKFLKQFCTIMP